ncbi:MAG: hypothetical protein LCH41_03190 [Armatimonadetes bacterium]|nr:hypothetical protein [Armatimonadota bacterium]
MLVLSSALLALTQVNEVVPDRLLVMSPLPMSADLVTALKKKPVLAAAESLAPEGSYTVQVGSLLACDPWHATGILPMRENTLLLKKLSGLGTSNTIKLSDLSPEEQSALWGVVSRMDPTISNKSTEFEFVVGQQLTVEINGKKQRIPLTSTDRPGIPKDVATREQPGPSKRWQQASPPPRLVNVGSLSFQFVQPRPQAGKDLEALASVVDTIARDYSSSLTEWDSALNQLRSQIEGIKDIAPNTTFSSLDPATRRVAEDFVRANFKSLGFGSETDAIAALEGSKVSSSRTIAGLQFRTGENSYTTLYGLGE